MSNAVYQTKPLKQVAHYSKERIDSSLLNKENYIGTDNLLQNKQGKQKSTYVPTNGTVTKYNPNDTLVANIRPYLKKIWFANVSGGASSDVLTFTVKSGYNPKFFYYSIFRDEFFDHMMLGSKGTRMPRGSKIQILEYPVPDIELKEQGKIAKTLSVLDSKIDLNNRISRELEVMAKNIYDYWFVQFDFPISTDIAASMDKPELEGKPYKSSGGKMIWSEELKRDIPEGWVVGNLKKNSLTTLKKPGIDTFEGEKIYLATADVINNQINFEADKITLENRESRANMQPIQNSVWFAKMKNSKKILYFGEYSDYFINTFILSTGFVGLICRENFYLEYIWGFINNDYFEIVKDRLANGATQEAINNDSMAFLPIIIPMQSILKAYHQKTFEMFKKIYLNQITNHKLAELRNWLLPMLMNGQVKVES